MSEKKYNSLTDAKVNLRKKFLELLTEPLNVLECFAGVGMMWELAYNKTPNYQGIEIDRKLAANGRNIIYGKAVEVLPSLDLDSYNVFDLDAFANPWAELDIILSRISREDAIIFLTESQGRNLGKASIIPEIARYVNNRDCSFKNNRVGIFRYVLASKLREFGYTADKIELYSKKKQPQTIYCGVRIGK